MQSTTSIERTEPEELALPGDTPAIQLHLREIGPLQRLTFKEEVALVHRIRKGSQTAKDRLVKANLRVVVEIARNYLGRGLSLLEMIGEGNAGFINAMEQFKPGSGVNVAASGARGAREAIKRALAAKSKHIRWPADSEPGEHPWQIRMELCETEDDPWAGGYATRGRRF